MNFIETFSSASPRSYNIEEDSLTFDLDKRISEAAFESLEAHDGLAKDDDLRAKLQEYTKNNNHPRPKATYKRKPPIRLNIQELDEESVALLNFCRERAVTVLPAPELKIQELDKESAALLNFCQEKASAALQAPELKIQELDKESAALLNFCQKKASAALQKAAQQALEAESIETTQEVHTLTISVQHSSEDPYIPTEPEIPVLGKYFEEARSQTPSELETNDTISEFTEADLKPKKKRGRPRNSQPTHKRSSSKAASQKEYYRKNREALNARHKEYYRKNREARCESAKEYREANREIINAGKRKDYAKHKEARKAHERENYYKRKAYKKENRGEPLAIDPNLLNFVPFLEPINQTEGTENSSPIELDIDESDLHFFDDYLTELEKGI